MNHFILFLSVLALLLNTAAAQSIILKSDKHQVYKGDAYFFRDGWFGIIDKNDTLIVLSDEHISSIEFSKSNDWYKHIFWDVTLGVKYGNVSFNAEMASEPSFQSAIGYKTKFFKGGMITGFELYTPVLLVPAGVTFELTPVQTTIKPGIVGSIGRSSGINREVPENQLEQLVTGGNFREIGIKAYANISGGQSIIAGFFYTIQHYQYEEIYPWVTNQFHNTARRYVFRLGFSF